MNIVRPKFNREIRTKSDSIYAYITLNKQQKWNVKSTGEVFVCVEHDTVELEIYKEEFIDWFEEVKE